MGFYSTNRITQLRLIIVRFSLMRTGRSQTKILFSYWRRYFSGLLTKITLTSCNSTCMNKEKFVKKKLTFIGDLHFSWSVSRSFLRKEEAPNLTKLGNIMNEPGVKVERSATPHHLTDPKGIGHHTTNRPPPYDISPREIKARQCLTF